MNTVHLIARAIGTCLLILGGSIVANWLVWILILAVMLPFTAWRIWKRRR